MSRCDRCGRRLAEDADRESVSEGETGGLCWREWNDVPEVCEGVTSFEGLRLSMLFRWTRAEAMTCETGHRFRVDATGAWASTDVGSMDEALKMLAAFCGPGWKIDHSQTLDLPERRVIAIRSESGQYGPVKTCLRTPRSAGAFRIEP